MKIAVCLRGISYKKDYMHFSGRICDIDYRKCIDSLFENLIKPLRVSNTVHVLFVTYAGSSDDKVKIVERYLPTRFKFIRNERKQRYEMIAHQTKLLIDLANDEYDCLIITRFDAFFTEQCIDKIDFSKINFLCRCDNSNLNDDNFIVIPRDKTKCFVDALDKTKSLLKTHRIVQNLDEYHFMYEGNYNTTGRRPLILFCRELNSFFLSINK